MNGTFIEHLLTEVNMKLKLIFSFIVNFSDHDLSVHVIAKENKCFYFFYFFYGTSAITAVITTCNALQML